MGESAFSDQLRAWRDRHNLTQADAAAALRVSFRTLQAWESGRTPDQADALLLLMGYLSQEWRKRK